MKKKLRHSCVCLFALAAALVTAHPASAAAISLSPSSQTVATVGEQVSVDVVFSDLGNGASPALAYYDLTVAFDSSILAPAQVVFSTRLGDAANDDEVSSLNLFTNGGVYLLQFSWLDAASLFSRQSTVDGSFVAATILFNTIGNGTTSLDILPGSIGDEQANPFTDIATQGATVQVGSVNPVPEPGTVALAAAGLGALALFRRRG